MATIYNGKKIIPAPFMSLQKEFQKSQDGTIVGSVYRITLNGTITAFKGSPDSTGAFWTSSGYPADESIASDSRLASIQRKQEALAQLFATEGYVLEIEPWDFTTPISCQPRIISINFEEALWFDTCKYQIVLEADKIQGLVNPNGEDSFTSFLQSADENWSLEFADQAENENQHTIYRLTHTVSAVGKRFYDSILGSGPGSLQKEAWEQARTWVQSQLGLDNTRITASGTMNLPSYYQGVNHSRTETVDKKGGAYGVTEIWIISSGTATEDFTVEIQSGVEDGLARVTINGTIQGYELRNSNFAITQDKYTSANSKLTDSKNAMLSRAQNYAGITLNPIPTNSSIGKNPVAGTITYTWGYDSRPTNIIAGALSENISITEDYASDVFAILGVPGRIAGPVLQDINTKTETRRSLSIEAVVPAVGGSTYAAWSGGKPDVSAIINTVQPVAAQVFINTNNETWSPKTGQFSRQIGWTYQ